MMEDYIVIDDDDDDNEDGLIVSSVESVSDSPGHQSSDNSRQYHSRDDGGRDQRSRDRDYHRRRHFRDERRDPEYYHYRDRESLRRRDHRHHELRRHHDYYRDGRHLDFGGSHDRGRHDDYRDKCDKGRHRRSGSKELTESGKSFAEMARQMLAGTLRDDHPMSSSSSNPDFSVPPPTISPVPSSSSTQPIFGSALPPSSSSSMFSASPVTSSSSHQSSHPVFDDIEKCLNTMISDVIRCTSEVDDVPSRALQLQQVISQHDLQRIYQTICPPPCSHNNCVAATQGQVCIYLPRIKNNNILEFSTEARAAMFKTVLTKHNVPSVHVAASKGGVSINDTKIRRREEERVGVPRVWIRETYLVCMLDMVTVSSSSVEHGSVSAPVKMSVTTGWDIVTRPVIPLQFTLQHPHLGKHLIINI